MTRQACGRQARVRTSRHAAPWAARRCVCMLQPRGWRQTQRWQMVERQQHWRTAAPLLLRPCAEPQMAARCACSARRLLAWGSRQQRCAGLQLSTQRAASQRTLVSYACRLRSCARVRPHQHPAVHAADVSDPSAWPHTTPAGEDLFCPAPAPVGATMLQLLAGLAKAGVSWSDRVGLLQALAAAMCQSGPSAQADVAANADRLAAVLLDGMGDAHFRVAGAALAALESALAGPCARVFEPHLDRFVPALFARCDAHASAAVASQQCGRARAQLNIPPIVDWLAGLLTPRSKSARWSPTSCPRSLASTALSSSWQVQAVRSWLTRRRASSALC